MRAEEKEDAPWLARFLLGNVSRGILFTSRHDHVK